MSADLRYAFGKPGHAPTWCSSAKDVVSTALGRSRIWFSVGHGILNEVYWPATGRPQVRDLGFIVAGKDFWTEIKRENRYRVATPAPSVPLPLVVHEHERYRLELEYLADTERDVILIRYELAGEDGLRLYPILAPHLDGSGTDNTAWVERRGMFAQRGSNALALISDVGVERASAGYVGASDGWQDFHLHGAMTWAFDRADAGNVALTAELPGRRGVLALALASTPEGAFTLGASALATGWDASCERFVGGWHDWGSRLTVPSNDDPAVADCARLSAAVLRVHEDRTYPGAIVASLSVPWGNHGDDAGGYHLVWPRDAVEAGLAMLSVGQTEDARRMLSYLVARQRDDGSWTQNFSPDGQPFWAGVQLDESALPVILAAKLKVEGWPPDLERAATVMVQRAATFLARTGPSSPEDRWEENAGFSPFALAVTVAALVAASRRGFLDGLDSEYALSLADNWNARVEEWTYVEDTELDRQFGIRGHYVRLTPPGQTTLRGRIPIKNRSGDSLDVRAIVGMEFLYLARLGLRAADDRRVLDTLRLVDALLRVDTPSGAFYRRYNDDGYGEHADGAAFDGVGIGRLWPLLAGERGHHAVLAKEDAMPYLRAMMQARGPGGLIPEQVWDGAPIPERFLYPGKATGSAMPLVWAHAEFLKLLVARDRGRPIEWLDEVADRYRLPRTPTTWHWRDDAPLRLPVPGASEILIESRDPFTLRWGTNGWKETTELESLPVGLGMHGVRLAAEMLAGCNSVEFTRRDASGWEGVDHRITFGALSSGTATRRDAPPS